MVENMDRIPSKDDQEARCQARVAQEKEEVPLCQKVRRQAREAQEEEDEVHRFLMYEAVTPTLAAPLYLQIRQARERFRARKAEISI